jgi:hypothetical protein
MADNSYDTQVNIDVETNIEPSIKLLKELKKQLKETAAGSEDFKKLSKSIKDVEDALEEAKAGAKGFVDQLEDAPGVVGQIAGAFRKLEIATKSFGAAFKAVGIGLIVSLVAGLAAAFSKSEDAVKKFEPLMIGLEKILNGLLEALMPLIDGFIELATNALPYVSRAFQVVYSAVTAVFQSLGKLGGAVVKLFKGDFKGAWADAKESVTGFSTNYDSAVQRFEEGTKKMTKTQKENLKEQSDDLKKAAEEAKRIREQELNELLDGQKEAYLATLTQREQEEYKVNEHYSTLLYLATKYGDDTAILKEAQAAKLKEIDDKYKKEQADKDAKDLEEQKKNDEEFAKYQFDQYEKINKLNQERADAEFAANQAVGQSWVDLGNNIAAVVGGLNNVFEQGSTAQKIFGVAQIAINAAASIGQILLNKAAGNAEFNKTIATGQAAILSALPKLFNPVTAPLGIAEASAGKAAIAGAAAGKIKLGINSALQIGVVGATSAAQIAAVLSAKKSSAGAAAGGGSTGGGSSAANIPVPTIAATAAPVIGGTQAATPGAQIAQTLSGATGKPIEAYVVSGKVTSQQALDRRTSVAATFGGY